MNLNPGPVTIVSRQKKGCGCVCAHACMRACVCIDTCSSLCVCKEVEKEGSKQNQNEGP